MKSSRLFVLFVLACCAQLTPQRASAQYKVALPGYRFEFPRDNFSHPDFQTEWWYTTGNLSTEDGRQFGFELTFFRQGVDRSLGKTNPWDVQDIYLAHLALSDIDGQRFYHTERTNRAGPGIAGIDSASGRIWNANWELTWDAAGVATLQAIDDRFSFSLRFESAKSPVIHGENGVSQKGASAGQASHYISYTRLRTTGAITVDGKTVQVSGLSWMDHEFFSNSLGGDQTGWDWLSLQFADNTELMLYRFRRKDGSLDRFSSGTFIDARGNATHLAFSDFTLTPLGETWTSRASHATYPMAWKIEIPRLFFTGTVSTRLKSQELSGKTSLAPTYWEGAIRVTGERDKAPIQGIGYLEMTGYDKAIQIGQ